MDTQDDFRWRESESYQLSQIVPNGSQIIPNSHKLCPTCLSKTVPTCQNFPQKTRKRHADTQKTCISPPSPHISPPLLTKDLAIPRGPKGSQGALGAPPGFIFFVISVFIVVQAIRHSITQTTMEAFEGSQGRHGDMFYRLWKRRVQVEKNATRLALEDSRRQRRRKETAISNDAGKAETRSLQLFCGIDISTKRRRKHPAVLPLPSVAPQPLCGRPLWMHHNSQLIQLEATNPNYVQAPSGRPHAKTTTRKAISGAHDTQNTDESDNCGPSDYRLVQVPTGQNSICG